MSQSTHQIENARLEHALLATWVNEADIGMCVVDDTSRVVVLNAAAASMLGVDSLKVINEPLKSLLSRIDGSPSLIQWLGTPGFDGEKRVSRAAGRGVVELQLKCRSVRTSAAERFKVVAITDVTELVTLRRWAAAGTRLQADISDRTAI